MSFWANFAKTFLSFQVEWDDEICTKSRRVGEINLSSKQKGKQWDDEITIIKKIQH